MYSGRQPASAALMATFSATTTVFRPGISPRISSRRSPAPASISATDFSVGGTTGSPSVQPRSKYASIRLAGSESAIDDISGGRALPAEPVDDGAAHHPLEVAALQPWQLLGEHRHALTVRARHAGDVGTPERAVGSERLEDLAQVAVDALVGIGRARVARSSRHLDRHVGVLREREHVLEIGEGRVVGHAGAAAVTSQVVDVELQARMPLGDLRQRGHLSAGQETDGKTFPLARLPEPVERAVTPPGLLLRLVEGEPEPEHARPLAPARDDLLAIRAQQIEVAENAELARVSLHGVEREHVHRLAERAGWVNDRAVDPGRRHLGQRVVDRVGRDLTMVRAHLAVLPEMNLGIDDQHGSLPPAQLTSTSRSRFG